VTKVTNENSPFGDNYMLATFGYMTVAAIIIPMTNIDLNDNMFVQFVSILYNFLFVLTLIGSAIAKGLDFGRVPVIGKDLSQVIGQVLFNFSTSC
jgi:hypothetical protein